MKNILKELKELSDLLYESEQFFASEKVTNIREKLISKTAKAVGHDLLVSLQNADWQVIKKLGNPPNSDRYLIVYRYKDMTELKYFIGDYDTRYGWNCELPNVEFIAWRKIPKFDSASILSN